MGTGRTTRRGRPGLGEPAAGRPARAGVGLPERGSDRRCMARVARVRVGRPECGQREWGAGRGAGGGPGRRGERGWGGVVGGGAGVGPRAGAGSGARLPFQTHLRLTDRRTNRESYSYRPVHSRASLPFRADQRLLDGWIKRSNLSRPVHPRASLLSRAGQRSVGGQIDSGPTFTVLPDQGSTFPSWQVKGRLAGGPSREPCPCHPVR